MNPNPDVAGECFPRSLRVLKRNEFAAIRERGRTLRDPVLRVGWLEREHGPTRLGLAVSARLGNAVVRNRIKRVIREAFRRQRRLFPEGLDLVVVPQDAQKAADYASTSAALRRIADKLRRACAQPREGGGTRP